MSAGFEGSILIPQHYNENGRRKHGSPEDRGAADRYYGRAFNPHWEDHSGKYRRIEAQDMSRAEIEAYQFGYDNEIGEKEYRGEPPAIEETIEW